MTDLLTNNLPLLAGAPDGIRKLRELILELAVRGKLVPQDPSDEPASELLKRIAAEKARLVAEGKIKKQKPLAAIGEEEKPFELPVGWEWTRLGSQVLESGAGWSPSCEARPREGDEWGVLKVSAVSWGMFRPEENKALPANLEARPEHEVAEGDFLVSRANTAELVARSVVVEATPGRLMLSDKIVRLKLTSCCDLRYMNLANSAPHARQYYAEVAGGTSSSMKNVSREQILSLPLALPPLPEQHRIVAKVDELMALCDRLEARQADAESAHARLVQALLDSLTQASDAADFAASWQRLSAHFHSLFVTESSIDALKQSLLQLAVMGKLVPQNAEDEPAGELLKRIAQEKARLVAEGKIKKQKPLAEIGEGEKPFELPVGWEWARLADLGLTSTGKTPSTGNQDFFDGDVPFIGPGQISIEGMIRRPEKWLTAAGAQESTVADPGEILMVCIGGSIGKAAIADRQMAFNQQINSVRVVLASFRYVFNAVSARWFQQAVMGAATGSATPIINRSKWEGLIVPLPPLPEQHRIVTKLDELFALCDQLKSRLNSARQLHARLAATLVEQAVA